MTKPKPKPKVFVYGMPGLDYYRVVCKLRDLGYMATTYPNSMDPFNAPFLIDGTPANALCGHPVSLFVNSMAVKHPDSKFILLRPKNVEGWLERCRTMPPQSCEPNGTSVLTQIFASVFLRGAQEFNRYTWLHGLVQLSELYQKVVSHLSLHGTSLAPQALSFFPEDGMDPLIQFLSEKP